MDDPEIWRWIWLVAAAAFFAGELGSPGSFYLVPFAIGATVSAVLAFAGVNVPIQAVVFLVISIAVFFAMRPLARRLDREGVTHGVGARRLIGEPATVLAAIPGGPHELGTVRVHREEWRAESIDGHPVAEGAVVQVLEQRGTRLVVTSSPKEI